MSVVFGNKHGWVVDAFQLIDQGYTQCLRYTGNQRSRFKCRFKECFRVSTSPYVVEDTASASNIKTTHRGCKKRKRKRSDLNQGEIDLLIFHEKIRAVILEGTSALVDSSFGYLDGLTNIDKEPVPSQECGLAALCEMAKELPLAAEEQQDNGAQLLVAEEGQIINIDLFSQVTASRADCATVVKLMGEDYMIPPHTTFLLSDFMRIQPLVQYGEKYGLIVLDPPWENRSVKRSRRYSSLPSSQLKLLPVPILASLNCLVVTWVTNRPSHLRFVRNELYPHWGVEVLAEWFWVKITKSGEFVFPLDSQHKKPYEVLVLGRYRQANATSQPPEMTEVFVEDQRLIVSVPSLHSQKPSLSEHVRCSQAIGQPPLREATVLQTIVKFEPSQSFVSEWAPVTSVGFWMCFMDFYEVLKPYVGGEAKCLELFARNLQPGWTSWGNEVLKFQHTSYFTLTPLEEQADISKEGTTNDRSLCVNEDLS